MADNGYTLVCYRRTESGGWVTTPPAQFDDKDYVAQLAKIERRFLQKKIDGYRVISKRLKGTIVAEAFRTR